MRWLAVSALFLLVACGDAPATDVSWQIVRSPKTGVCYEVAAVRRGGNLVAVGMAPVPCPTGEKAPAQGGEKR